MSLISREAGRSWSRSSSVLSRHDAFRKISTKNREIRLYSQVLQNDRPFRLAVIGSGPAGFYSAYRVMSRIQNSTVDMFEQLPVPFGLVRFGVAPDHPEVKNCQDKFTEVASSPRFKFIGNVEVGKDIALSSIRDHYDAILFAYGASKDRELNIPGENLGGVYSARAFVGWYNGLPEYANLSPDLESSERAVIIGQGNVALDVARVLLSDVDTLRNTDITEQALEKLSRSRIKRVHVIGRRGAVQAAFTIKELRELLQMPGLGFVPIPKALLPGDYVELPRPQKRIVELLRKHSETTRTIEKRWSLDFTSAPKTFLPDTNDGSRLGSIVFNRTQYKTKADKFNPDGKVEKTYHKSQLSTGLAFRSIGYKAEPLPGMNEIGVPFSRATGTIPNNDGKIINSKPGLYCAGWVKRGPTGVIATTMDDAFATAERIAKDWSSPAIPSPEKAGWEGIKDQLPKSYVSWDDWLRIDAAEKKQGKRHGKEREKFQSIQEMLNVVH